MQFTRSLFWILALVLLLFAGCKTSNEVQSIESTESKPQVIVQTKAAIVGGNEALQRVLTYPRKAKKEEVETVLKANVLVNKHGIVEQITFDKETEYGFEEAARDALHKVKFKAGKRDGEPINMYITIPVVFEL